MSVVHANEDGFTGPEKSGDQIAFAEHALKPSDLYTFKNDWNDFGPVAPAGQRQKSVDPLWDRYFELTFGQVMAKFGGDMEITSMVQVAGETADKMLAEREKRAK